MAKFLRSLREEGLRIEDFRALSLEAVQRLVGVVLIAALSLLNWSLWDRRGGATGPRGSGRETGAEEGAGRAYLALRGWQKLLNCLTVLAVLKRYGQLETLLQALDAF